MLSERGFDIDRRRIELREPIKEVGEFTVSVRVGQDVTAKIALAVTPLGGALEEVAAEADEEAPPAEERRRRRRKGTDEETVQPGASDSAE